MIDDAGGAEEAVLELIQQAEGQLQEYWRLTELSRTASLTRVAASEILYSWNGPIGFAVFAKDSNGVVG